MNPQSVEGVFIGYTENPSQYLVWVPERKKVIKATNPIFIKDEDQWRMPVPRISESAELERAQQIKILSLDDDDHADENVTENSSDENEFLNLIDRVTIQTSICEENDDENDDKLGVTTRSGQTVRLTEKM